VTPAQQLMVQDGLPAVLLLTSEQRAEAWRLNPPRAMPLFQAIPRNEDAATSAFRAQVEAERRQKSLNQIAKMKNRFAQKAVDHSKMRWDPRAAKFVPDHIPVLAAEPQISPTVHGGKAVGRTAGLILATGATTPVTKNNARALAEAAGVWKPEYEKLTGGLLCMTVKNRLRGLRK
jgi:hypothetical protein